ncbi:non-ribosomal peptide synthetase [Actinoplanes sp. N902-109]|uniref:non-ribosomal peptide synthetase n=1 Tax=Actinoplanes sp. (strain N902-109) TaxID=649831 RepID=UPI0003295D59|nr:non-ribosomal peptide synthetase [Actinoplanes sp. N902-109]AGL16165.1 amino acid adenylation domain-containing protein [Actinoplanes sp. N902-109]
MTDKILEDKTVRHLVVVNDEDQYSTVVEAYPVPAGWRPVGIAGTEAECLDHIAEVWTDMRPASLAGRYAEAVGSPAGPADVRIGETATTGRECLHQLFADVAAASPDRVAVVDSRGTLTYAEVDAAANRLAHRLIAAGVGPEDLVALCAERFADLIVGVIAVLKAGAGYLPLDPTHPVNRAQFVLDDADCRCVLADDENAAALAAPGRTVVRFSDVPPDAPDTAPDVDVHPGNVAYVIYTSGSTGRPKGVVVSHANVTRLFETTAPDYGFGPDDVWTLFHSIAFDFSVWELWGALLHGGRLVVVDYVTSRDPAAFLAMLRRQGVTVLNQTPTAFRHLAGAAEDADFPPLALRWVIFGGEPLDPAILRPWAAAYGVNQPRLVNMYGITETTVHVTIRPLERADLDATASPIGVPIGDLRVHILDTELREVPAGVQGEMYVGGPGVSRGYLGRPALTAQRFVPDPFGTPGGRLYRTGDLAVRSQDGEIAFRGRSDTQVQLRGFRIELGEIERAMLDQPGVRAAVCLLREDVPQEPRLVAYVVPAGGELPDLRARLAEQLPAYMLPSAFMPCAELPLTANGKLDRAALPAPEAAQSTTPHDPAADSFTDTERALARIWADELGIETPGAHDNFFAVGGDSITVIRVGVAARAAGLPVTIERVFRHPTIAELAAECDRIGDAAAGLKSTLADVDADALPDGVVDAYPAAGMQLGILYECEMADDQPELYHDLASARLLCRFDTGALRRALDAMTERHEVLRTSFDAGGFSEPMQLVHRQARIPLLVEEAESPDPDGELRAWWKREQADPFNFETAPLVRCHVLVRGPDDFHLSVALHHIVLDGWSVAQLMTDLLQAYDTALAGGDPADPAPAARYRDFVAAERAAIESPETRAFWTEVVAGLPDARLPRLPESHGECRIELPDTLDAQLRDAAARVGTPQKSLYLAAHLWALARLTGRPAAVTGVQMNGRLDEPGSDRLLGVLLNVVPMTVDVSQHSWATLARAVFDTERAVQPHRRYPVSHIRRLSAGPLYEIAFNFVDFHNLDAVRDLTMVKVADWWFDDIHSFGLRVEFDRSLTTGARLLCVTTGLNAAHLSGTASTLGGLVREALELIAADVQSPCPPIRTNPVPDRPAP